MIMNSVFKKRGQPLFDAWKVEEIISKQIKKNNACQDAALLEKNFESKRKLKEKL